MKKRKNIIEIKNLFKTFGNIKAVDDLSFNVKEGELFAFLGVNGAGKSTTINIMCGDLRRDKGEIIIDTKNIDYNLDDIKGILGVVFQNSVLDKSLSVYDNLYNRATLYGINKSDFKKRLTNLSKLLNLSDLLKRPVKKLSGGQRRRIDIARAIIHNPKILILDEPTTGLDPKTRCMIWNTIENLQTNNNMTVFLTTHYMEEAADADYVVIIDSGKIVAEGKPLDLKNKYTGDFISIYNVDELTIKKLNLPYESISGGYKIKVDNTKEATDLIIKFPDIFLDYEVTKGKMDDVFLAVTGKQLGGDDND